MCNWSAEGCLSARRSTFSGFDCIEAPRAINLSHCNISKDASLVLSLLLETTRKQRKVPRSPVIA